MTDEALKGLAYQVANMAKHDLRWRGQINGVLAICMEGKPLRRLRRFEREIEALAGKAWLNSGRAKDIVFSTLAFGAGVATPDAIAIATAIDDYRPTPAFDALPQEKQEALLGEQFPRRHPQYFVPHDALMSVAQTPERVCLFRQRLQGTLLVGEPEILFFAQADFDGRLKMFGVEPDEEILKSYTGMTGKPD